MKSLAILCFGAILITTCHPVQSGETERIVSIVSNSSNNDTSQRIVHRKRIRVIKPPDTLGSAGGSSNQQDHGLRWVPYDMPGVENVKLPPNHNRFSVEALYMSPANYGQKEGKPSQVGPTAATYSQQHPSRPYQPQKPTSVPTEVSVPAITYHPYPKPTYGQPAPTQRPITTPRPPPVTRPPPTTTPLPTTNFPPTAPTITQRPPTTPFPILNPEPSTPFPTFPPSTTSPRPPPPMMTTTSTAAPRPITSKPTTPIRPPSTLTPIFVPTFSPHTTTEAPNIGTEGPDDLRFRAGRQFRGPPQTPLIEVRSHEKFDPKYIEPSPTPPSALHNRAASAGGGGHSMRQADVVNEYEFSIKCWKTRRGEYFRAEVRIAPGTKHAQPYIKDQPYNPMTSDVCKLETLGRENSAYRMLITDFAACGVKRCNNTNYCLDLVIPRMPGIALLEDEIVRLQCELQKSTVAETKTYGMTSADAMARPTTSTVLGEKSAFIAELVVFKPELKGGIPNQRVDRGGAVHMGEKLEIRTVIRDNDGWRYSRLTDVVIWRSKKRSAPGQVAAPDEMIQLVDSNGCLIPGVEEIAKHPPFQDEKNLLVNRFLFRAFAFKGQEKDEPLVVTGTVQACLEAEECEVRGCERPQRNPYYDGPARASRYRRSATVPTSHFNGTKVLETKASSSFLVLPKDVLEYEPYGTATSGNPMAMTDLSPEELGLLLLATAVLTMLVTGSLCCAWFYRCGKRCGSSRQKAHRDLESSRPEAKTSYPVAQQSLLAPSLVQTAEAPYAADFRLSTQKYPKSDMSVIGYSHNNNVNNNTNGAEYQQQSYRHRQLSPQPSGGDPHWRNHNNEEGVYVVYCCNNNDDALSSKSAPSSLRSRNRSAPRNRYAYQCGNESDESDLHPMSERIRNPRTVRSVKRSQKSRGTKIRRRLSSIYREVYGSRTPKNSSEPKRTIVRSSPDLNKDRIRHLKKKLERAGYHGTVSSEGSSEFDSAYSGGSRKVDSMEAGASGNEYATIAAGDPTVGSGNAKSTYKTGESVRNHRVLVLPATDV